MAIEICRPGIAPKTRPIRRPGMTMNQGPTLEKSMSSAAENEVKSIMPPAAQLAPRISNGIGYGSMREKKNAIAKPKATE